MTTFFNRCVVSAAYAALFLHTLPSYSQAPAGTGGWVKGNAPQPPKPATSAEQIKDAFPPSNFGPNAYVTSQPAVPPATPRVGENGVAPLPPLSPPAGATPASGLSPDEIKRQRAELEKSRRAKAYHPVRAIPKITSISVDLSPGASLPVARTLPGQMSTLVFLDSTGAPWPLAATPRVSDGSNFDVEWLQGTPSVIVSSLTSYEAGNLTVFLVGLATPVMVQLATGEPDTTKAESTRVVDVRLDLRIPGRGPNARAPLAAPSAINLYDDTMQSFLDGIPPTGAKRISVKGNQTNAAEVWQFEGALFIRTRADLRTSFDQTMASADGTKVYKLSVTPFVTLSELNKAVTLQLDIY